MGCSLYVIGYTLDVSGNPKHKEGAERGWSLTYAWGYDNT